MASDERRDEDADAPGEARLPVPVERDRAPSAPDAGPLDGEVTKDGPIVVVTAIALKRAAREALAQRLGPGHLVVDIRRAGKDADIVLVPPGSPQLVGAMRGMFPDARLLATEFTDDSFGADFRGPIIRVVDSGIDGYFMASTMEDLAQVTHHAARAVAGALTAGSGSGGRRPVDFLQANRRLMLGTGEPAPEADEDGHGPRGEVTIDLDTWARALHGDALILADLAWPLILQVVRQGVHVVVVGDPPDAWTDRARGAGVEVRPSPRRLTP